MSNSKFSFSPNTVKKVATEYRNIQTDIPVLGTEDSLQKLEQFESRSMQGQMPLIWDKAVNSSIFDKSGNKWIDFTSTIFVTNTGNSNPVIIDAVKKVLDKQILHSYAYANEERISYCEKLVKFAGNNFEKVFLLSAGTESTEAALKLMRLNGLKLAKRNLGIICVSGNWHGRTMGAQLLSDNTDQKKWIGFEDKNIHHINFPYPWNCDGAHGEEFFINEIKKLEDKGIDLSKDICGFMLETFQGWAACFYPKSFVKAIRKLCDEKQILLAFDEMQSGFARTGKKFGYEHYDVTADLLCVGKGMASGFPLSGVIGTKETMDLPDVGEMSSTHSANPICCAAGNATIDFINDENLVEQSKSKGEILHSRLQEIKNKYSDIISWVLGKGLIASVIFNTKKDNFNAAEFATKVSILCFEKGLLVVHTGRESIKIGPPLTIETEALLEGVNVLEESIAEVLK